MSNNEEKPIYFDYASTTPVDPRVANKMIQCLTPDGEFGNPASRSHPYGWDSEKLVEEARQNLADLINCSPKELVWTSGATESDNLAIKGAAEFYQRKGKHIITSKIEHKAVLDSCRELERQGYEVTYLEPNSDGIIEPESLENAIRKDTTLVSLMHVNNEIGTINDIERLGRIAKDNKAIFHVDAAQSLGKLELDMANMPIDLVSFSGHKIYGPKVVGALYTRRKPRVRLAAQIHGGGHERGLRSGTLPTHQVVGMGEACRIAKEEMNSEYERVKSLRDRLWSGLSDIEEVHINGHMDHTYPGIFNISFNFVEGESLIMALNKLAVSSGSACTSASLEPSYVLRALGRSDELAHSSIRFSIGRFTSEEHIDKAIQEVKNSIQRLRDMSPLWEMYQQGIDINSVEWATH